MGSAQGLMAVLGDATATIPALATHLEVANATGKQLSLTATDGMTLDDLLARYTMETERAVHREFLEGFGVVSNDMRQLQDDERTALLGASGRYEPPASPSSMVSRLAHRVTER